MTTDTDRERALVEAARAVEAHMLKNNAGISGNAPSHAHQTPGVWDIDPGNGVKGGTACEWCAQWAAFQSALAQYQEPSEADQCPNHPGHRCQVDTSMESGPNNCFHCERPM